MWFTNSFEMDLCFYKRKFYFKQKFSLKNCDFDKGVYNMYNYIFDDITICFTLKYWAHEMS